MSISSRDQKRKAVVFPKNQKFLGLMGENIELAIKRRGYNKTLLSNRTGLSRVTIGRITQGDSSVSIGHYLAVLSVLGLAEDLTLVAKDDELGKKLQDIALLKQRKEL